MLGSPQIPGQAWGDPSPWDGFALGFTELGLVLKFKAKVKGSLIERQGFSGPICL